MCNTNVSRFNITLVPCDYIRQGNVTYILLHYIIYYVYKHYDLNAIDHILL